MMNRILTYGVLTILVVGCAWTNKFELPTLAESKSVLNQLDAEDKAHFDKALSYTLTGQTYTWYNRKSQNTYRVKPQDEYYPMSDSIEAEPCRVYYLAIQHGSFHKELHRTACRRSDKTWSLTTASR